MCIIYIYIKKKNKKQNKKNPKKQKKQKTKLHYTALLLWLQSRLNNFTAFYSQPKEKSYEMSESRGIVAISLLESRNK